MHVCTVIHNSRIQQNTTSNPTVEWSVEKVGEITQGTVMIFGQGWGLLYSLAAGLLVTS